jgi:hypothetical protein
MSARVHGNAGLVAMLAGACACACALAPSAHGAAPGSARAPVAATPSPAATYAEECGACHVAYPTRLLAGRQWNAILTRLDRHFGVDASLDDASAARVAAALGIPAPRPGASTPAGGATATATAGAVRATARADAPATLPRITTQPWFQREHNAARLARHGRTATKLSQCDSCHTGAAGGRFEEEDGE